MRSSPPLYYEYSRGNLSVWRHVIIFTDNNLPSHNVVAFMLILKYLKQIVISCLSNLTNNFNQSSYQSNVRFISSSPKDSWLPNLIKHDRQVIGFTFIFIHLNKTAFPRAKRNNFNLNRAFCSDATPGGNNLFHRKKPEHRINLCIGVQTNFSRAVLINCVVMFVSVYKMEVWHRPGTRKAHLIKGRFYRSLPNDRMEITRVNRWRKYIDVTWQYYGFSTKRRQSVTDGLKTQIGFCFVRDKRGRDTNRLISTTVARIFRLIWKVVRFCGSHVWCFRSNTIYYSYSSN